MSDYINSQLLERAAELIDEYASHPSGVDRQLMLAVESGNLEEVYRLVSMLEAEMAQEHFQCAGVF